MIIAAILTVLYVLVAEIYGFKPISFSSSYYGFEKYRKGMGRVFSMWCFLVAILAMPILTSKFKLAGFITCGSLFIVGLTSAFHDRHKETTHYLSAILCGASIAYMAVLTSLWIMPVTVISLVIYVFLNRHKMSGDNFQERLESIRFNWWGELSLFLDAFIVSFLP